MKNKQILWNGVVIVSAIAFAGSCGTIIHGTHQMIPITTTPAGVEIKVGDKITAKTPYIIELPRKRKCEVISYEKDGYESTSAKIERDFSEIALIGNLSSGIICGVAMFPFIFLEPVVGMIISSVFAVLCPVIGVTVDLVKGGAYTLKLDNSHVVLAPKGNFQVEIQTQKAFGIKILPSQFFHKRFSILEPGSKNRKTHMTILEVE